MIGLFVKGYFNLYDGTIQNCTSYYGGGVSCMYGTFHMYGGLITKNRSKIWVGNTNSGRGGGVMNGDSAQSFHMHGGTITGNIAEEYGGGIFNSNDATFDGKCIVKDNYAYHAKAIIDSNKVLDNACAFAPVGDYKYSIGDGGSEEDYAGNGDLQSGSEIGITLETYDAGVRGYLPISGAFTDNGSIADKQYFNSDNDNYLVHYNNDGYLELVEIKTLYFGQNANKPIEYSLYTDKERTKNYYTGFGTSWSVEWSAADNKPQLNLNNFNSNGYKLEIDAECIINITGTNNITNAYINGVEINKNITIKGSGTLNISSSEDDAMAVNAIVTINDATVKCNASDSNKKDITFNTKGKIKYISGDIQDKNGNTFYPSTITTLYLTKTSNKEYALYIDEDTCNFEFAKDINGAEETVGLNHYAVINLKGETNKKVVFKQDTTNTYSVALRINGSNTKLGGLDVSEGTLTVQSAAGNKIILSGDLKAQKLYMAQCNGLIMEISDADIIAAEKQGVTNELMIASSSSENKISLTIKNGSIKFEKGNVTLTNTDVNIGKNSSNVAAEIGINAHKINLEGTKLIINDVNTGIKLYEPTQYGEGAVLSINKKSNLTIDAKGVGVQGTYGVGGNYYNNITVIDDDSIFTITGGTKAVASTAITPIPTSKIIRSSDNKNVEFKINSDVNFTTDYYYKATTNIVKSLTLKVKTVYIDSGIENGSATVDDYGADASNTVTITVTPDTGYELAGIVVKDKDGTSIAVSTDNKFVMPTDTDKFPVTVSASFVKTQTLSFTKSTITKLDNDAKFTQAVNGANTTVTYSSSNPTVATIDPSTGEVTILKIGTTTIKATAAKSDTYGAAEATYTLTITDKIIINTGAEYSYNNLILLCFLSLLSIISIVPIKKKKD